MKSNTLRGYQQKMLQSLYQTWRQKQSVMVQMPTGTGKTHLMAAIVQKYADKGVLVVAHRRELIAQISQTLDSFGVKHGLIVSGNEMDYSRKVQVASIQTLARRRTGKKSPEIDKKDNHYGSFSPSLVIVDEAHHALADTYRQLWEWWPKAKFLGLTATPCRLNGKPFTDLFDQLLQSWNIREFIQEGWLSDLDYISVRSDSRAVQQIAHLDKRNVDGDFQTKQMAMVLDVPESIDHLYQSYQQYAAGKKGIVYAIDRQHAQHIAAYYVEHGVRCAVIDSKTPEERRRQTLEDYRRQTLDVLVNVDIFSEGFDCPEVEFIQLARPTMSLSKYLQQVGRGMRVTESKKEVIVLDQVGSYLFFGLPTSDRNWQGMFLGKEKGKGVMRVVSRENDWGEATDKMLVNEEMLRIKSVVNGKERSGIANSLQGELMSTENIRESIKSKRIKEVELFSEPYDGLTRMCMKNLKPRMRPEEYITREMFALLMRKEIVIHLYNSYKKHADGRKGVVFAYGHTQAEMIADYFSRKGVKAKLLFDINGYEIAGAMKDFQDGETTVLVSWHRQIVLPEVEFIELAYPMQQMTDYLNIIYNCMPLPTDYPEINRMADSNDKLVVIDNTLMSETFGSPTGKRDWQQLLLERQ